MPTTVEAAVDLARVEAAIDHLNDRFGEMLALQRKDTEERGQIVERLVKLELRLEHVLKQTEESGERSRALVDKLEALQRRMSTVESQHTLRSATGTGPHAQLTAAHTQESKERSLVWRAMTALLGALTGGITAWLASRN